MDLKKLFPKDLYHSYVIEGDPKILANQLLVFLEERGDVEKNSQDVLCQIYQSLKIEDSYEIKNWHNKLGITKYKKVCILGSEFINKEAEQALLKIIEEPGINTHYFIIVPDVSLLLPTIISRVHVLKTDKIENQEIVEQVSIFIKLKQKERIEMIAKMIKDNKEKDNSGQLRSYATLFVNQIEHFFYQKFKQKKTDKKIKFILDELQKSRGYLSTPGASVKMILEHLALVI